MPRVWQGVSVSIHRRRHQLQAQCKGRPALAALFSDKGFRNQKELNKHERELHSEVRRVLTLTMYHDRIASDIDLLLDPALASP